MSMLKLTPRVLKNIKPRVLNLQKYGTGCYALHTCYKIFTFCDVFTFGMMMAMKDRINLQSLVCDKIDYRHIFILL